VAVIHLMVEIVAYDHPEDEKNFHIILDNVSDQDGLR